MNGNTVHNNFFSRIWSISEQHILSVAVDIALQYPHEHVEQILLLYNTQK